MHAVGILSALRARGIEPGRDVAVASFDNVPEAAQHFPGLTSADGFPTRVGSVATELVLHAIAEAPRPAQRVLVQPVLQARDSTLAWAASRATSAI
jgi:LacI family transcriptional regulator